jgi:hypothetical protein
VLLIAVAHPNQLFLSDLLLFALGALSVSSAAIATLVGERGATLATTATVIGGFGAFCGALGNGLPGFSLAVTVAAQMPRDIAARYLVTSFTS